MFQGDMILLCHNNILKGDTQYENWLTLILCKNSVSFNTIFIQTSDKKRKRPYQLR